MKEKTCCAAEPALADQVTSVGELVDALGKPVDARILRLVALLRHLGFNTVASCEGHLEREPHEPYVLVENVEARALIGQSDEHSDQERSLRQQALQHQRRDFQRMDGMLRRFYEKTPLEYGCLLIAQSLPPSLTNLTFQSASRLALLTKRERQAELETYWQTIEAFQDFLLDEHANWDESLGLAA